MYPITFPNLGIEINVSPIAFTVLGKDIYWYGIIIAMGILLSLLLVRINIGRYEIKWDDVIDFLTFAIIISIISARIYYVAFRWDYYSLHPYDIIKIWNGRNCNIWWNYWSNSNCYNLL
jgi:phosphatidylglycerol:prolipoprotein diacylglycerol transferase